MSALHEQALVNCNAESQRLTHEETTLLMSQLSGWQISEEKTIPQISKNFVFKNFLQAMAFANAVGELAEQENHHPCICIEWGKVAISWWTHSVDGLFINDFIMADRCNQLYLQAGN